MSSETRQRSIYFQDIQDSSADQDRKGFNRKHNVQYFLANEKAVVVAETCRCLSYE